MVLAAPARTFRRHLLTALAAFAFLAIAPESALAKLDDKEWAKAKRDLEQALTENNNDGIIAAVDALAADQSKRAVDLLVNIGAKLDDIKVYEAVKRSLAGMTEPEAIAHMVESLQKKTSPNEWTLRCVLCECLTTIQADGVTAALVKTLDDKIPYVISAAAKSLGKRKDIQAVPGIIARLRQLEKSKDVVWVDVKQSLTDITGHDFADAKEWDDFWKVRGATFNPETDRGDKNESSTVVRPGEESGEFFKEKILAKRIMFVIDVSGSMRAKDIPIEGKGLQTRIQVVKDELIRCIKSLKKDVRFNIVAYDDKMKFWRPVTQGSALHQAEEGNKADAMKWASNLKENGMTHTDDALKEAFKPVEVNQIILLSDGQPAKVIGGQEQAIPTGPILEMVKGLNRLRGVKINTFGFAVFQTNGQQPLLDFLSELATQNGGKLTLCGGGGKPKPPPQPPGGGGNPPSLESALELEASLPGKE